MAVFANEQRRTASWVWKSRTRDWCNSLGRATPRRTNFNFNQDMAGQTVTLIAKLSYDLNNNVTAGKTERRVGHHHECLDQPDEFRCRGTPQQSGGRRHEHDLEFVWLQLFQANHPEPTHPRDRRDLLDHQHQVLTGANATFANALLAAGITPPSTVVNAGTSTVSASPLAVPANGTSTSTVTVTLKNADSIPIAGKLVSLSGNTRNATIQPAGAGTDTTNGGGQATFTVKSGTVETVVFSATGDSVPITQTASVEFTSPLTDAGNSTVTAAPATVPADGATESVITVTLKNSTGLPLLRQAGFPGENRRARHAQHQSSSRPDRHDQCQRRGDLHSQFCHRWHDGVHGHLRYGYRDALGGRRQREFRDAGRAGAAGL